MRHFQPLSALVLLAGVTLHAAPTDPGEPLASEAVIDAPVQAVWHAMASREGMEGWAVAKSGDLELRLGARWRTSYDPKSTLEDPSVIETEVLAFDPGRMLALRILRPPADFPFPNAIQGTWYVIYLEPVSDTRTRVVHRMFGFTEDEESQQMRAFFERGNAHELRQLAAHLAGRQR
jgi:uncharacterized protein YndB with AHSA1/START domain